MPNINVRWADNTETLRANLQRGTTQLEATRSSVDKLVKAFTGENLIAAAHKWAVAIEQIGGAAKLSAAEQQRANAIFEKAAEKLQLMGKGGTYAAEQFRRLAGETKKLDAPGPSALNRWLGELTTGVVSTAAGFVSAQAIIGTFKTAIGLLASELATLTTGGAGVADVAENFNHMTESAGRLGSTLLTSLREGTHATITDLELMKLANQDLAAGLNLTDQQFRTLATGAFALAQATGGDVKTALDTMNDAMLTGRTRALAMLTGKIDLEAAETKYAKSIGTTRDHLTEEGKLEAARAAILEGVAAATGRLGEQTDGLDEIVAQAQTAWANFQNELGKTVASSPVLISGFEGIRDILKKVFGPDQESAIKAIAAKIDEASIAVLDLAVSGVQAGGFIRKEWIAVEKLFGNVRQAIDYAQLGLQSAAYATGAGLYNSKLKDDIHDLIVGIERRGRSLQALDDIQAGVDDHTKDYVATIQALRDRMKDATGAETAFVGPLNEVAVAHDGAAAGAERQGLAVKQTAEEIKKAATAWAKSLKDLATDQAWLEKASGDTFKRIVKMYDDQVAAAQSGVDRSNAATVKGLQLAFAARTNANDLVAKQTLSATDYQVFQIEREFKEKQQALRDSLGDSEAYYRALNDLADERMAKLNQLEDKEWEASHQMMPPDELSRRLHQTKTDLSDLAQAFSQLAQVSGDSFGGVVQGIGQGIAAINVAQTAIRNLNKAIADGTVNWTSYATAAVGTFSAIATGVGIVYDYVQRSNAQQKIQFDQYTRWLEDLSTRYNALRFDLPIADVQELNRLIMEAAATPPDTAHWAELKRIIDEITGKLEHFEAIKRGASQFGLTKAERDEAERTAHEIFDFMKQEGTYTQDALNKAYYAWQKALAEAGNVAAQAWVKAHDEADKAATAANKTLDDLIAKRDALMKTYENEAPELEMGKAERDARAQVESINAQIEAVKRQSEEAAAAAADSAEAGADAADNAAGKTKKTFGELVDEAIGARDGIEEAFKTFAIHIPVFFDMGPLPTGGSGGAGTGGNYAADGGIVKHRGIEPWSMPALSGPRGTDRVPVWLSEGETVRTPQQEAAVHASGGTSDVGEQLGAIAAALMARPDTVVKIDGVEIVRATHRVYENNRGGLRTQAKDTLGIP